MQHTLKPWLSTLGVVLVWAGPVDAQDPLAQPMTTVVCTSSSPGERQHCAARTSAGVLMARPVGNAACLLGKTWGYDDAGIWVLDGCGAEFLVAGGPAAVAAESLAAPEAPKVVVQNSETMDSVPVATAPATETAIEPALSEVPEPANETYGYLDPGGGFLVGKTDKGELSISGYALVRYLNQVDDDGVFTDHLGRERPVDGRQDIYGHRVIVWLTGWAGIPQLRYTIGLWTVNTTDQDAIFGNIGYQFNRHFNWYAGIFGNPGSRSMQGSHPYWLGHDRVMADEFFRPFFTQGTFVNGEILPGLWYSASIGNSSSTLGNTAAQLDRDFTYGGSIWWTPTTGEFGPRGAYGDWEMHDETATRFGLSVTYSPEERYTEIGTAPGNTALRLADSLNVFESGALVPGVTVTDVDYRIVSVDAGMKYRGFFLQGEYYYRVLDNFRADGVVPMQEIKDHGFYLQAAFYPIPRKLEVYGATSQIFAEGNLGFDDSSEYLVGMNYYPADTRNHRFNLQYMRVNGSPASSNFGYYVGGLDGNTFSLAASVFY